MDESVDKGDDTRRGGEHLGPFSKGFVGGDNNGPVEVSPGDDLEEEIGVTVVVVEISDLVDGEDLRLCEASQASGEGGVGVLGGELVEHVAGHGETRGIAVNDGVVDEILGDHGLADAVGSEKDDVDGVVDKGEREELVDEFSVDALGPLPVEVGDGFEGADGSESP